MGNFGYIALISMVASMAHPILATYSPGKGGQINFYTDTKCSHYNGEVACWWNKTPFIGLAYEGGGPGDCFQLNMPGNSQSINIAGMWKSGGGADSGGSASSQPDEPPHPSFEELRSNEERVLFSPAAKRLYWPLEGVFPSAISVMRTSRSVVELEPFFRPDTSGSGSGTWHEISSLPLTDPKVSSVEASLRDLDQWESDWLAWHRDHTASEFSAEYITYGDLSDEERPYANEPNQDGSWEDDSDAEFLIRCCENDRPLRKGGLKIKVTSSAGNNFVTVHDYVSAVHPWLMGLRGDIMRAKAVARPVPYVESMANTEWIVSNLTAPQHEILTKELWIEMHRPPRPLDAATSRFLQRVGARTVR
ncbi:hypothetical protein TRIATDRAFT_288158 [Trichoderma atroviride IMI 206040]|uniref:Uncharacterized protein n=1 Tax=Hypocrea atroviridis (strain ATCC 20476 / IMI 206040) TaxID=452589 RepID=G9PBY2_HYPAI|nr:uncharacterized protein TRIATDRAFT_288158 [Trichoderma atroviride IMI 206040]EHK39365.1 hypothetical protein TRIATDRAFT_288158 [Trichoderma atroviride IMI 206040]